MNPLNPFEKTKIKNKEPENKENEEMSENEVQEKSVQTAEPQVNVLRSEFDGFIMDRMRSQPKSLEEIDEAVFYQPTEGRNQLSLPDELKPYEKKYAFCWIFRHKKAVDEACNLYHWSLCNRLYFPDVAQKAPHVFSNSGAIERGDNILAFRSKKVDQEMRKAPGLESSQRIKRQTEAHVSDPAFYIPKSDEYETDPKTGKRIAVPIVGV